MGLQLSQVSHRLFTVDDYYRMAEAGILHEDDRVELIEGEIIQMPPIGSFHASVVDRLTSIFHRTLGTGQAQVRIQGPVRLSNFSEPVPDLALLLPSLDFYSSRHPLPPDAFLLVEVADSTLIYDRQVKLPLYAKEGIPEFWIVDLTASAIEIYREPSPTGYGVALTFHKGDSVSPTAFPDVSIAVEDIFGG